MSVLTKLNILQTELKVGKTKENKFANFKYRSAEDIYEAVKPLLNKQKLILTLSDDIIAVGNRFYIKATATLKCTETNEEYTVSGLARETENKKGMDDAQVTGSCSSYARKYALGGLFLLDGNQDPDSMDNSEEEKKEDKSKKLQEFQGKATNEHGVDVKTITNLITAYIGIGKDDKYILEYIKKDDTSQITVDDVDKLRKHYKELEQGSK